jgi:hypothetical protein
MVAYSVEEDSLLLQLRYELTSSRGCAWSRIKNRFNTEMSQRTHKKYTVAMLRNRLARIEQVRKKPRNRCGICGKLLAGHTCKRIQGATNFKKVPEKVTEADNSNPRVDMNLDIILPTEAEISEAFMYM